LRSPTITATNQSGFEPITFGRVDELARVSFAERVHVARVSVGRGDLRGGVLRDHAPLLRVRESAAQPPPTSPPPAQPPPTLLPPIAVPLTLPPLL
jgi:hypothetical protein